MYHLALLQEPQKMAQTLALVTYLCDDYDRAIAWFRDVLGFVLLEDTAQPGKRWVRMAPHPAAETGFLIARATTPAQVAAIGKQSGDRVGFFLFTDDFDTRHAAMLAAGVHFRETPRMEPYGKVAVFEDLYGAPWDLIQPAPPE